MACVAVTEVISSTQDSRCMTNCVAENTSLWNEETWRLYDTRSKPSAPCTISNTFGVSESCALSRDCAGGSPDAKCSSWISRQSILRVEVSCRLGDLAASRNVSTKAGRDSSSKLCNAYCRYEYNSRSEGYGPYSSRIASRYVDVLPLMFPIWARSK